MNALALFGYFVVCLFIGFGLTVIVAAFRPVKKHDDFKSWRWTAFFTMLCLGAPYAYAEVMTNKHGAPMQKAVESVIRAGKVKGKLAYYKVLKADENTASVIIVGREKTTTNPSESVVMSADLVKKDGKWRAREYRFVDSFQRNRDGFTFPPYW
jgi:hypothetical protein